MREICAECVELPTQNVIFGNLSQIFVSYIQFYALRFHKSATHFFSIMLVNPDFLYTFAAVIILP